MASWLLSLLPLLQVRHFYYRTWHKISKYLRLAPDAEGVRAHKELHGLINYGEMWKKLGGYFNDRCGEKLNELVRPLPFFFLFANKKKTTTNTHRLAQLEPKNGAKIEKKTPRILDPSDKCPVFLQSR